MFVLIWNCRGARSLDFSVAVKDLVVVHNPAIMIIIETRVRAGNVSLIMNKFPLDVWTDTNTLVFKGGIWLLWCSDLGTIGEVSTTKQEIHTLVKVSPSDSCWLLYVIYVSPKFKFRRKVWDNLKHVWQHRRLPWLMAGDFNRVLASHD